MGMGNEKEILIKEKAVQETKTGTKWKERHEWNRKKESKEIETNTGIETTEKQLGETKTDIQLEEFIDTLTQQMRCARARDGVARELSDHITDQTQAYEQAGMAHEQAVARAVREMGDPVEIGVSMDRIHRPQLDWRIPLLTLIFSIAGILCLIPMYGIEQGLYRQGLFILVGFVVIAAVCFVDYSIIGRISIVAYFAMTVVLFICSRCMRVINGRIPVMSILVYLYVPLFAGILYQLRMKGCKSVIAALVVYAVTFVACTFFSASMFVSLNILLIALIMLFAAIWKGMFGAEKKRMTALATAAVSLPAAMFLLSCFAGRFRMTGFRMMRIKAFFHRDQFSDTYNYVYTVIDDILRNARFVGKGGSTFVSEKDFTYTAAGGFVPLVTIHVYGIIAGLLLLALFVVFTTQAVRIVRRQKNQLGFLVSMGCMLVIFLNGLEGMLVTVGLFPSTTVVIPFLTYGGSTTLMYATLIGLMLSVHRYERVYLAERYAVRPGWRINLKIEKR